MEDFYFNFKMEKLWTAECKKAEIIDKKKEVLTHPYNIDVIGLIDNQDGYFVNIRGIYPDKFEVYKIDAPINPIRVFL